MGTTEGLGKIYIYKLAVDNGGAPCVWNELLSLAICKPMIRSTAQSGATILGFAADSLKPEYPDNCLIYVARVTRRLKGEDYFSDEYAIRPDCIYSWNAPEFKWRPNAKYHSEDDLVHDLGEPDAYNRANVLLSEGIASFRYFRNRCPVEYRQRYPLLGGLVEALCRGHRVNFTPELENETRDFMQELFRLPVTRVETLVPETPCADGCTGDDDENNVVDCGNTIRVIGCKWQ